MNLKELAWWSYAKIRNQGKPRDTIFRALFGQDKKALLELYNALNGSHYENEQELEIMTIESALFITCKNDVAFMLAGVINLYEHQSTVNPNMPLRFLIYLGQEYQKIIEKSPQSIYGKNLVPLPTPKCVVFYNGDDAMDETVQLRLSEAYANHDIKPDAELTVQVININVGHNEELMKQCRTLEEYAMFIEVYKGYKEKFSGKAGERKAIRATIDYCLENNILRKFIREQMMEIPGMLLMDFDKRKYERTLREEGYDDGVLEGKKNAEEKAIQIIVKTFKKTGVTKEDIVETIIEEYSEYADHAKELVDKYWE